MFCVMFVNTHFLSTLRKKIRAKNFEFCLICIFDMICINETEVLRNEAPPIVKARLGMSDDDNEHACSLQTSQ